MVLLEKFRDMILSIKLTYDKRRLNSMQINKDLKG